MGSPYSALREEGYPAYYGPLKTAVTVDVLEWGFITAFLIIIASFICVIPGIRGWQRLYATVRYVIGAYLLVSIFLSLYGMEWEVAEITDTPTYYKAFETGEIHADIKVKIGLNAVNITLKSDGKGLKAKENIDYNERFHFYGGQGLTGFSRFAGRINREFREAQWLGKPYPILWIAEYFTLDGEGIRWGRSYRQAGYYTWIMVWTSFPLYLISVILFFNVIRYGAYFLMGSGTCMLTGNVLYATVRYGASNLVIPFSAEKVLRFEKGSTFFVCLFAGLVAVICGIIVLILDYFEPEKISTFFNVDPLIDYEETFVYEGEDEKGHTPAMDITNVNDEPVASKAQFRQKTRKTRRRPKPAPRSSSADIIEEAEPEPQTEAREGDKPGMNGDKPATNGETSAAIAMSDLELKEKEADSKEADAQEADAQEAQEQPAE